MQIKHKYFPYPVIATNNESYETAEFYSDISIVKEGFNIKFHFVSSINNDIVNELIKQGKIEFAYHIECPQTCFRTVITTDDGDCEKLIHENHLNGKVQLCSLLVAKEDIINYCNPDFASDYKGFKFNIQKGCILGIGKQMDIRITKEKDDLTKTSSIFSFIPVYDETQITMQVETNEDKIIVKIPRVTFNLYNSLSSSLELQPMMHAMIIVPALIVVLDELKVAVNNNSLYEYERCRWFKALKKACKKHEIDLDERGIDEMDSYTLAQLLMEVPASKTLDRLSGGANNAS